MRVPASKPAVLAFLLALTAAAVVFPVTVRAAQRPSMPSDWAYGDSAYLALNAAPAGEISVAENVVAQENGPRVSIEPPESVVELGDIFTVTVAVEDALDLISYEFQMDWDASVFTVTTVTDAGFVGSGSPLGPEIDNEEGTLTFGLLPSLPPPEEGASGDGSLAVITLRAAGVGTSTLDLHDVKVWDTAFTKIYPAIEDGMAESTCEIAEIVDLDSDSPVELGQPMHFTASVNGAEPITYTWDFDSDGSPERIGAGLDTVTHTYAATGTYTVTLAVDNVCGVEDKETLSVTVEEACDSVAIMDLTSDSPVELGQPMHFTATVTGAEPITYTWDFGDGGAGSGTGLDTATPTWTYVERDVYTVTLTVENGCPSQATETLSVIVGTCEGVTIANLSSDSPVRIGEPMHFTATVTGTEPYTYTWDFGDGGAGSGAGLDTATPTWIYAETDTYTVTLTVENPCDTDEDIEVVRVEPYGVFLPLIAKEYWYGNFIFLPLIAKDYP